jgi:hypothetical protein
MSWSEWLIFAECAEEPHELHLLRSVCAKASHMNYLAVTKVWGPSIAKYKNGTKFIIADGLVTT